MNIRNAIFKFNEKRRKKKNQKKIHGQRKQINNKLLKR